MRSIKIRRQENYCNYNGVQSVSTYYYVCLDRIRSISGHTLLCMFIPKTNGCVAVFKNEAELWERGRGGVDVFVSKETLRNFLKTTIKHLGDHGRIRFLVVFCVKRMSL